MERSWLRKVLGRKAHTASAGTARRYFRPRLEVLEDRAVPAGLVVIDQTGGVTPTALVNALVGAGVTASNVTYKGTNTSSGTFTGGTGIIGFESGIVLSTGNAKDVVGPNKSGSTSTSLGTPGDPNLDAIVAPQTTFDATVLEFDFIPQGATLKFNYVFSSEEYNEFVGQGFSDVFAFFLNGNNVALLPGTNTPINIDTVNLTTNPQFYVNNGGPTDPTPTSNPLNTEMDGLTVVLPVTATVNPGVVNHIKLAIADTQDSAFDSNVFIQSGSFAAPPAPVFAAYRPFRYAFRSLEQNEGIRGPIPVGGLADTTTFDGNITVINTGNAPASGPLTVEFRGLPAGVQLVNASGIDPATNQPFITVPIDVLPNGGVPLRIPVKFSNPLHKPLGTFFVGPYFIDVASG